MAKNRIITFFVYISLLFGYLVGPFQNINSAKAAGDPRTDAIVLVNSTSANFTDFQHYIQSYLDYLGVPYTLLDIASTAVPADIGDYALIIVGHRRARHQ